MTIPTKKEKFGKDLHYLYPSMSKEESLRMLMGKYGSIRGIHRETGIPLSTLSRWCSRLGVFNENYPVPGTQFTLLIQSILKIKPKGKSMKWRLKKIFEEEGSWSNVARLLGVEVIHLRNYRRKLGLIIKNKEDDRGGDSMSDRRMYEHEEYYG